MPLPRREVALLQRHPVRGFYYCFGCGEGGDVITFVTKIEGLTFNEAVERLAEPARIELRYAEGGYTKRAVSSERARLLEANKAAAQYYREQLGHPGRRASAANSWPARGFDQRRAEHFRRRLRAGRLGPLVRHLRGRGFTDKETAHRRPGLAGPARR